MQMTGGAFRTGHEAIRDPSGASGGRLGAPAKEDGRSWFLDWGRPHDDLLASEVEGLAGPRLLEDCNQLLDRLAARVRVRTEHGELLRAVASRPRHVAAPARDQV